MNMLVVGVIVVASLLFLVTVMFRSIQNESRANTKIWKNFALSLSLFLLFIVTWLGHGIAQWENFKNEQEEHNQLPEVSEFLPQFAEQP